MRDYADLPNDLPRPPQGSVPKPAEPPAPPPPPPPPRLVAQGVWEDPATGRWTCYVKPPVCDAHANSEMMLRDRFDGNEAAVREMIDKEALRAEDAAIRRLDAETADVEARYVRASFVEQAAKIHPGNVDYAVACDPAAPGSDRTVLVLTPRRAGKSAFLEMHLQREFDINRMAAFAPIPFQNEKTATSMLALMEDYERQLKHKLRIPQHFLAGKWD
jgi:hypothetical protein